MSNQDHEVAPESYDVGSDKPTTELLERMEAALLSLPRFTREVFLAHRLDDLSYLQIAKITGVSVRRVEREMARAILGIDRALTDPQPRSRWWRLWGY